jgi:uncharacterized protein with HEPN domain
MDERIKKWLCDIVQSADEIEGYFENEKRDFFEYRSNVMLKRAVERNLEIIGEAMNRILTRDSSFEVRITKAKAIIGLRNQVIHAYDSISDESIWSILINHLPILSAEVRAILDAEE